MEDMSLVTPMALAHPLILLEAGRGIRAESCGLDDVFPLADLVLVQNLIASLYTWFILWMYPISIDQYLSEIYLTGVGLIISVYKLVQHCYLSKWFQLYSVNEQCHQWFRLWYFVKPFVQAQMKENIKAMRH